MFDYRYLDQDTNETKFDPIDGYEIQIKEIKGKSSVIKSLKLTFSDNIR